MVNLLEKLFPHPELIGTELATNGYVSEIDGRVKLKIEEIGKKVKYIAGWSIHQLTVSDSEQSHIELYGLYPIIVHADAYISERFTVQSYQYWSKSSYLKAFHLNCLFETINTTYVLCNGGKVC